MEQTKVEAALKRLWREYIKLKMQSALDYGDWSSKEERRLDSIKKTDEIVKYVEEETIV